VHGECQYGEGSSARTIGLVGAGATAPVGVSFVFRTLFFSLPTYTAFLVLCFSPFCSFFYRF